MSVTDKLRTFILEGIAVDQAPGDVPDEAPLLDGRILDSLGIFRLVSYIEMEFGVEVLDEELVPEHFATIGSIADLVNQKLAM